MTVDSPRVPAEQEVGGEAVPAEVQRLKNAVTGNEVHTLEGWERLRDAASLAEQEQGRKE